MAGCCDEDTQNCGWAKSCVNYDAYTKKSYSASQYCVTWTYPSDGVADYGCASYNSGVETIYQFASDLSYSFTTSMTLPTLTGDAVTGWDGESSSAGGDVTSDFSDIFSDIFTSTESDEAGATDVSSGGSGGTTTHAKKTKKKSVSVGVIAGAVVGGLVVLFLIGAAIIFCCVKKRKAKQLADNQHAIAAAQANRPQSQVPPQQPPMQQHVPAMPVQSPQQQQNGYFAPQDQKINYQAQTQDYGVHSPVSSPSTPAPAYVQPYYAAPNAPPVPTQESTPYPAREPTPGTYEVDAITASQGRPGQSHVYEMGSGK
ncbi:hypothetical protein N0V90_002358 [Kalmusia sp. IMI 367209]|nr:hypothetical protein N0V90_002358 [Kalmusia sp. IMI 367209]